MDETQQLINKVFNVRQMFFQCLHTKALSEPVHPAQAPILGYLLHNGGGSQADIVRLMHVSAATVAVSVARLEKLGFVTRERNQANQRANVLQLTEKGRNAALQMQQVMEEMGRVALKGFSAEDCRMMEGYCSRIIQNLQSQYKQRGEA